VIRPAGWFAQLVQSGEYHRLAAQCTSDVELAERLGCTADAIQNARARLRRQGVAVPTVLEVRFGAAAVGLAERPGQDLRDEILAERPGVARLIGKPDISVPAVTFEYVGEWQGEAGDDEFAEEPPTERHAVFANSEPCVEPASDVVTPKILLLDIETAPATAYVWKLFDENISLDQLITPSRMLCWAAKWYGGGYHGADERDGRRQMLEPLHGLLSEADAVVTYNGERFDLPKINGEFVVAGMRPVPPTPSIDLYKTAKQLGYQSNKLMFVAKHLGIGEKISTEGFKLWRDVMAGSEEAWARMLRYNKQDVALLENLYAELRPFIRSHPAMYVDDGACIACGSPRVHLRGSRRTRASSVERMQCQDCGAWFDGRRRRAQR
jgi:hypothetical protein